jgi:hypothetical protein
LSRSKRQKPPGVPSGFVVFVSVDWSFVDAFTSRVRRVRSAWSGSKRPSRAHTDPMMVVVMPVMFCLRRGDSKRAGQSERCCKSNGCFHGRFCSQPKRQLAYGTFGPHALATLEGTTATSPAATSRRDLLRPLMVNLESFFARATLPGLRGGAPGSFGQSCFRRPSLGFPNATVVVAPFGVYLLDPVQAIQIVLLSNCADEGATRHNVQRFLEWLPQAEQAEPLAKFAKKRKQLVELLATQP